ncbi:cysteine-rich receptor-like protein kinase 10 [Corylus avellana]|uniref:cysteine-rich receptor-like protein kinase 10 n=1 Tax=Corylus avellana TaxID=13451 RepID=UPI00286AD177|nr:cysteine-rich receptor-like protein kinase 10 [Corylus avellana]
MLMDQFSVKLSLGGSMFFIQKAFLFLLFAGCALMSSINSQPITYNRHYCGDQPNNSSDASFESNLTVLLGSLSSKASQSISFYNNTSNGIYGLFLCRGDVNTSTCQSCVSYAAQNITSLCPSNTTAIIWFDQCMLRYSNTNFFGVKDLSHMEFMWNVENRTLSQQTDFGGQALMNGLIQGALGTEMLYKAGSSSGQPGHVTYGLVQCTRDINSTSCGDCFQQLMTEANRCCQAKIGWRVLAPSCNIRYENYSFIQQPPVLPPAPPPQPVAATPPPLPDNGGGNNTTKIVSITVSSIAVVAALLGFWYYSSFCRRRRREEEEISQAIMLGNREGSQSIDFMDGSIHARNQDNSGEMHYFNLRTIQAATNNFSDVNKLGEGGFGPVYKGKLIDGKEIAVKRLSIESKQGLEEFKNEVLLIVKLQHKHLVRLLGCCLEGGEKLLVYEYMANTSLDAFLFDPAKSGILDWAKRTSILNGIARGLLYLHEDSRLKIIHRDMKASNVLLDDEMNPKISDFGTARIFEGNQIEANTNRVVGTYGYMAPEYAMEGQFSVKSDVYSFGVLMLEIISGKKNMGFYHPEHAESLLSTAWRLWNEGKGVELIDQTLVDTCPGSEALRLIHIALLCVQEDPSERPTMSMVVLMLGSSSINLPRPLAPPFSVGRPPILSDQSTTSGAMIRFSASDQSSTSAST